MLTLDFINVGYGDAALLRTDGGFTILVDCGDADVGTPPPGTKRLTAAAFLAREGVRRIDVLVLTHLHSDHIGGLPAVLGQARVGALWTGYAPAPALWNAPPARFAGTPKSFNKYVASLSVLARQGCQIRAIEAPFSGMPLAPLLTCACGVGDAYLLARQKNALDAALMGACDPHEIWLLRKYINIISLRLCLTYRGKRVLLPGDAYARYWEDGADGPCAVLKAPHHGCPDSVTEPFLARLRPDTVVVPVSNDRQDVRPGPAAVALMQRYAKTVRFTDAVRVNGLCESAHESVRIELA